MKTNLRIIQPTVAATLAIVIACVISVRPAQAGYIVTLEQVGSNVVATGSGPIDLTGLKFLFAGGGVANINPKGATLGTGPFDFPVNFYESSAPFSGPTNFGSGDFTFANSGSGDFLGIQSSPDGFGSLLVPTGYVSGNALSDSATYNNKTLKRLGATPGTYEWTWGTGANQNFTLDIVAPGVPDSGSTLGLLFVSVIALFGLNRLRRVQLA